MRIRGGICWINAMVIPVEMQLAATNVWNCRENGIEASDPIPQPSPFMWEWNS